MGVVYLAEDSRLRRQVALKVLHPALTLDTEFVSRFASEARAIATLTHPGIVGVHAFEEVGGSHLIDMEYIEGRSLDKLLARGPVGTADAINIAARVLEALGACHARSMVHRDIKPSNILIATDGRVLLSDFGLAMSFALASASAASSSCFIGTPKYAPPESWDKTPVSPAGDVYSTGLVILELLAGKTPFDGDTPLEIMRKSIQASVIPVRQLLPQISDGLAGLLEGMLAPDPSDRPSDAGIALQWLRETPEFAELPDDARDTMRITPPRALRVRSRLRSHRGRWLLLAVFAVLMPIIGLLWQRAGEPDTTTQPLEISTGHQDESPRLSDISPDINDICVVGDSVVFVGNAGEWRTLWGQDKESGKAVPLWPTLSLGPKDGIYTVFPVEHGAVAVLRMESDGLFLFRTDGTADGTIVLAYAESAQANRIEVLGANDGKAYFNRIGGDDTFGLWETDGTIAGTRHRWGDWTTPVVSALRFSQSGGFYFSSHTNSTLYFWPKGAEEPFLLWPEFGSGTAMGDIISLGENILAAASSLSNDEGVELWMGTPEPGSLREFHVFTPGPENGFERAEFGRYANGVVFAARVPGFGRELWYSDGTEKGTCLIYDINPGTMGSNPYRFTESGGLLYFSAQTAGEGQELWVSDGTGEGTHLLTRCSPGLESSDPYAFCAFNGGLLFTPHDPVLGEELWFTDGTPEGTRLLFDCMPGPESGSPHGTVVFHDRAIFGANHPEFGRVLWETDGTPEGTRPMFTSLQGEPTPAPRAAPWTYFRGQVYIVKNTAETGAELWVSAPASDESMLLRDIHPGPQGSNPREFFPFNDYLYFVADDGLHGVELWRTDGTQSGTALFYDSRPGRESGNPTEFVRWGDNSFAFTALGTPDRGYGIFYYEFVTQGIGIAGGTDERGPYWRPTALAVYNDPEYDVKGDAALDREGWLHFSTQNAAGYTTLWRTDGRKTVRIPTLGRVDQP